MPVHIPESIRTDSNAFASNTMRVRIPAIIQQTLDINRDYAPLIQDALKALRDDIAGGQPIPMQLQGPAPDTDDWAALVAPFAGDTWHNTFWFIAEVYAYRLLMEAVRWWETGRDPFLPTKVEEEDSADLWDMIDKALDDSDPGLPDDERLHRLIHSALWGNRIDLSFKAALERGTDVGQDDLLVDDSPLAVRQLIDGNGPVHLILDNHGRESAMDLVLADALLDTLATEVYLHVKFHPTFVSDAVPVDILRFLDRTEEHSDAIQGMGERLNTAFEAGQLRIIPDSHWNSTYFLRDMPPRLGRLFEAARLVIVKGDMNYRRVVNDAMWPGSVPFADVVDYFPAPLLCLRALKGDTIAGLTDEHMAALDQIDADWHWNGKRGVMQSNLR
ncbi:damage-control phosphatase ARMT1 family protein [Chloroflexota bacterium]